MSSKLRNLLEHIARIFIRTSSFLIMEIVEILRQPRLVLTLVLGPFLILLLFGIGYRNEARPLRTMFVVPENEELRRQVEEYAKSIGPQLVFSGITADENVARRALGNEEVDAIVIPPTDAYNTVRNNEQAVFRLYHNELDPIEAEYVNVFGRIYVDEMNRRVLRAMTEEGQTEFSGVERDLEATRQSMAALRLAAEVGDRAGTRQQARALDDNLSTLELAVGASLGLLAGVSGIAGEDAAADATETSALLGEMRQDAQAVNEGNPDVETLARLERNLGTLEERLSEFQDIDAAILVSPFRSEVQNLSRVAINVTDFYAPAVIVLLLQHLHHLRGFVRGARPPLRRDGAVPGVAAGRGRDAHRQIRELLPVRQRAGGRADCDPGVPAEGADDRLVAELRDCGGRAHLRIAGRGVRHLADVDDDDAGRPVCHAAAADERVLHRLLPAAGEPDHGRAGHLVAAARDLRHPAPAEHHAARPGRGLRDDQRAAGHRGVPDDRLLALLRKLMAHE